MLEESKKTSSSKKKNKAATSTSDDDSSDDHKAKAKPKKRKVATPGMKYIDRLILIQRFSDYPGPVDSFAFICY